ncbi:MAG: type II toxin-antitoxin system HicA family toxin [Thaumarchaeota archaeon]|nr:type II toxin-antitoxin system HicA family toxin [Nitrososphaerota archaeon]MCL5318513.1 type II toxin-antitoxin system HicA family toxin [Nitrososphaerota archaeon]
MKKVSECSASLNELTSIHGRELIKILCNIFGFRVMRQKGSHATLYNGKIHVTVPTKRIQMGLLKVILEQCGIAREQFLPAQTRPQSTFPTSRDLQ